MIKQSDRDGIRFMYIRDANWGPVGCLAIKVSRSKNRAEYGFSIRNPADAVDAKGRSKQFDRLIAKDAAELRLQLEPHVAYVSKDASQHDITRSVLQDIIAKGRAPSRAVKFAKRWLSMTEFLCF